MMKRGPAFRRVTGALAVVLVLALCASALPAAGQEQPPFSTPPAGERPRPPVDDVRRGAEPFPIPTREPGGRPGRRGPEQRVPGRSATETEGRAMAPRLLIGLAAVAGLVTLAGSRRARRLMTALGRRLLRRS